ncbi:MAG: AAA family ATPase, partial [Actinomycetota bacterium]|nr:AAA family ATPase [Actinomycetota bacterium]
MSILSPFVGRAEELAVLTATLESLERGLGQAILIEGEPGIGKSRLVIEALEHAKTLDLSILQGSGRELERDMPFGAVIEALDVRRPSDQRRAEIRDLLSGVKDGERFDEARLRLVLIDALVELIEAQANKASVVLVVEDLQWADQGTYAVLHRLLRRSAHLAVGLLCTSRLLPWSHELDCLAEAIGSSGTRIRLGPLSDPDVERLAKEVRGAPPAHGLAKALSRTGGNPLFVLELLSSARSEDQSEQLPRSLAETIRHRLRFLSESTLELLQLASLLGSSFDVGHLSTVAGRPLLEIVRLLDEARWAGVILDEGERLRFRHDLVRDALYEIFPKPVRAALHSDAARALADAGYGAPVVAAHLVRAGGGDIGDVSWLRRAARELSATAPEEAANFLDEAAARCPRDYPERAELEMERASLYNTVGRPAEAAKVTRRLLAVNLPPSLEVEARLALLLAQLLLGALDRQDVEALEAAARSNRFNLAQRARLLAEAARAYSESGDLHQAQLLGREAVTTGIALGDEVVEYLGRTALATSVYWAADQDWATSNRLRAFELAMRSQDPFFRVRKFEAVYGYAFMTQFVPKLRDEAREVVRAALREA